LNRPWYRAFGLSAFAAGYRSQPFFLGRRLIALGFAGFIVLSAAAESGVPGIWRSDRVLQKDGRVAKDRLHSKRNPND
jgi:hypothetical protein